MGCSCKVPVRAADPRSQTGCLKCCKTIDPELLAPAKEVKAFFDHLEAGAKGRAKKAPADFVAFRHQCEAREIAGREHFGLSYLSKDNCADALEESADAAIYMVLETVKQVHQDGDEADRSLALAAAWHSYLAFQCARQLSAKRRGSP